MKTIRYFLIRILGGVPVEHAINFASQYAVHTVMLNCSINSAMNEKEVLKEIGDNYLN